MTIDRTAAPVRPAVAERSAAEDRSFAARGFGELLRGARAASDRPAARASSGREPAFVLAVAAAPVAAPRPVAVSAVPSAPGSPVGAVAASLRAPAVSVVPTAPAAPSGARAASSLPAAPRA